MPDRDSGRPGSRFEALACGGLAMVARLAYAVYSHISYDDAHISLRYATNLAAGHGLVFNLGERVFGASTPLYVLILAFFSRLGLPMPLLGGPAPLAWGKALAILADGTTVFLWHRLLRSETGSRWPGRFFTLFFSLCPLMIETAVSGMETSLVLLAMTLALTAALSDQKATGGPRRRGDRATRPDRPLAPSPRRLGPPVAIAYRLGLAIGLLGLLRSDALLFGAVLLGFRARWTRRVPWREALIAAACMAPWYLFAWSFYGSPLPNSIPAKVAAYNDHLPSEWPAIRMLWSQIGPYHNGFGAEGFKWVSFTLFLAGLFQVRSHRRLAILPVYLALYLSFLILPRTLLFRWYLPPALMTLYGIGGLGALWTVGSRQSAAATGRPRRRGDGATRPDRSLAPSPRRLGRPVVPPGLPTAYCLLPTVVWLALAVHSASWAARTARRARNVQWAENHTRREIGLWLREHTPSGARVALEPIGYVGYYSQRTILDEVGLVTPRMIPLNRAGDGWFGRMVRAEQPDYIVERYYYLVHNQTLLTGVQMFATQPDRQWFFQNYRPVRWYCWDLRERLGLSEALSRDYAFVIYARSAPGTLRLVAR